MTPKERINITIYTDGSCNAQSPTKLGGFGVYCVSGGRETFLRRGFWNTTTSRMEMKALLAAIQMVDPDVPTKVHIISDSQFVVNSFKNGYVSKWRMSNWVGVKNAELWKEIVREIEVRRKMVFGISWMNGHGNELNDPDVFGNACADELADYKTQDTYAQDKPLERFCWYYHGDSDCIFVDKEDKAQQYFHDDAIIIGECRYPTPEELLTVLDGKVLFEDYINGRIDVDFKVEMI